MNRISAITGAGAGFKARHFDALIAAPSAVDFIEVHAENYLGDGGLPHHQLTILREQLPLSVHGVGLSLGGADAIDEQHLARVAALVSRYEPALVSEHLAWSVHNGTYFADLLPLPYNDASLARLCRHIDHVQSVLKRRLLIENPSHYLHRDGDTYSEGAFLRELVLRTGCGLLVDVNNIVVSCHNLGCEAVDFLADYPLSAAEEIHLAGHSVVTDEKGERLAIDDHGSAISTATWALYDRLLATLRVDGRTAPATVVEWDRDVPNWSVLQQEITAIREHQRVVTPPCPSEAFSHA